MIREVIRLQYRFDVWAGRRVFDAAEKLTAEQRAIPGHAGHGSIHDTLLHMAEVRMRWHTWLDGSLPAMEAIQLRIDRETLGDVAALRAAWEEHITRSLRFAEAVSEEDLTRPMLVETPWTPSKQVPLWQLMLHVANHEVQHRSEVAAMLTEHGTSPGYLDLLFYILDPANNVESKYES